MGEVSRRRFLKQTSVGVGVTLAAVAALPNGAGAPSAAPLGRPNTLPVEPVVSAPLAGMSLLAPMVVHVRDVATAEIAVLVGDQEFIYRDPALVTRLIQTANQAAQREA
jgi:hypothetical protein